MVTFIPCPAGNLNQDEIFNVNDVVFLINFLFKNGDPPCSP